MTRIGLISDTHMPQRFKALPSGVFDLLNGVDCILHAGDVGELWVLDQLSRLAPVIAVHGNDETSEATAALPYLQTLCIAGHRVVITHAHYPDRADELASRTNDWQPHVDRRVNFAQQHGASIIIYGHFHIPMLLERQGILLVNPGAIASGNPWTRQTIQTIAIMSLQAGKTPDITHYDVKTLKIHKPMFDPAGFEPTFKNYNEIILESDVYEVREWLWSSLCSTHKGVLDCILALGHLRWEGHRTDKISAQELATALLAAHLPQATMQLLRDHPLFALYMT
ncbi:MAG: metallophosphoesterase family protein [Armatimonadetes bacterium]|nr:metallophosphoesterase family protein [Anaerolineae bacterium]